MVDGRLFLVLGLLTVPLAGCMTGLDQADPTSVRGQGPPDPDASPYLGYKPFEPDLEMALLETSLLLPGEAVEVHARVVRPEGDGPFPVVVQFTPYTAPGRNVILAGTAEPVAGNLPAGPTLNDAFVNQFVRRGYAFVYADVRGTGDSSGCLDLRGQKDIDDAWFVTEYFGTQPWSSGKVGFIGASYPGSEAHMAALANNPHLGAVIPVVASTSFYHYHHNDGVPYNGNHALGGTNSGYVQSASTPTMNPQEPNFVERHLEEAGCDYPEYILDHGGMDQTGAYYEWWQERNLRGRTSEVKVPVLMAQGLADWNVKPDHIAHWFNDLEVPKTLIAGQWPHQYPRSPCDDTVPYGNWWAYATAFFDTYLRGVDTGMFQTSVAWIQDSNMTWHRSSAWPLPEALREGMTLYPGDHSNERGSINLQNEPSAYDIEYEWLGCPNDTMNRGTALATVEDQLVTCDGSPESERLVFETRPFERDVVISGVPLLHLTLTSTSDFTHLTAVIERVAANGTVMNARENYGYLNPTFRNGLDSPEAIKPGTPYEVTIDFYPQEDLVMAGDTLRVRLASDDAGRTIESYTEGTNTLLVGPGNENWFYLPLRPADLQGTRLAPGMIV